jgi:hypothetical protein
MRSDPGGGAMAYANFDLKAAVQKFELSRKEEPALFHDVEPIPPSDFLRDWLAEFAPVAVGFTTEQARREFIITPILAEAKRRSEVAINVFPGAPLMVDEARGLTGICDYLITRSREIYFLEAPIAAVVEAKREDLAGGLGQCVAEMVAIQLFNEREGTPVPAAYGCVTSGNLWKFLRLEGKALAIDSTEYGLGELAKILGIVVSIMRGESERAQRS